MHLQIEHRRIRSVPVLRLAPFPYSLFNSFYFSLSLSSYLSFQHHAILLSFAYGNIHSKHCRNWRNNLPPRLLEQRSPAVERWLFQIPRKAENYCFLMAKIHLHYSLNAYDCLELGILPAKYVGGMSRVGWQLTPCASATPRWWTFYSVCTCYIYRLWISNHTQFRCCSLCRIRILSMVCIEYFTQMRVIGTEYSRTFFSSPEVCVC